MTVDHSVIIEKKSYPMMVNSILLQTHFLSGYVEQAALVTKSHIL